MVGQTLTLYFSATGNTAYVARLFSEKTGATCLSIEDKADFAAEIKKADTIAFCYPIYGSRVPRLLREFVAAHMEQLSGKRLVVLVTQMLFSGDGARALTDMFAEGTYTVACAEHFFMPNNVCNLPVLRPPNARKIERYKRRAERKMLRLCADLHNGVVRKRGFSPFSKFLGNLQGRAWQGNTKGTNPPPRKRPTMEEKARGSLRFSEKCDSCGLCVGICPMKNIAVHDEKIRQLDNCMVCYRCVNRCPKMAATVLFHRKPRWQYKGL